MNTSVFRIVVLLILVHTTVFSQSQNNLVPTESRKEITTVLELWHRAAAKADYDAYFGFMTKDAVFIGTDPTENWQNEAFRVYSKPHFDKGKAWTFNALERNVYMNSTEQIAWFDELLDTQMGICRGSGIVQKVDSRWKIKHYVLSITIPNANVKEVKALKNTFDKDLKAKMAK